MLEKSYGTAGNDFPKPFCQLFSHVGGNKREVSERKMRGKEGFGNLLQSSLSMEIGVQYMVFLA